MADRSSVEASHVPRGGRDRDVSESSPTRQHNVPNPPPVPQESHYERLRKLGAIPFMGTLDPAEPEAWLESTDRIFNLMQCTLEERFDYAVFLLQGDASS